MNRQDILSESIDIRDYNTDEILENEMLENMISHDKVKDFIDDIESRVNEIVGILKEPLPDLDDLNDKLKDLAEDLY